MATASQVILPLDNFELNHLSILYPVEKLTTYTVLSLAGKGGASVVAERRCDMSAGVWMCTSNLGWYYYPPPSTEGFPGHYGASHAGPRLGTGTFAAGSSDCQFMLASPALQSRAGS